MAFLSDIKSELCAANIKHPCCRRALLLGILFAKGEVCEHKIHLRLVDREVLSLSVHLIKEQFGREAYVLPKAHGGRVSTLCFESAAAEELLHSYAEELEKNAFVRCQGCLYALLKGLFLAAGYMTNPTKAYRVELSLGKRAEDIARFLEGAFNLSPKILHRREEVLIYFKDSTAIEEIMTMLGVSGATFHLMNSKIEKQFRNEANRRTNCESGNINRSVEAAARTVTVLKKLEEEKLLSSLPDELEDAARLRLLHPEESLAELAAMMTPPITKSGLNHRLKKVIEYARLLGIN